MIALSFRDVRVRRGPRQVLHVAAMDVEEAETLAVLGPNGAGKSTLLLAGALLLELSGGEISVFGEPAQSGNARVRQRRLSATVFQEPALLDMSVRRNIETALALHEVPRTDRRARSDWWLSRLGVAHLADAQPHNLSGGEAQRVSLARAFAVEPRILFLDEPFSSLDTGTRAELVGELRTLLAGEATTSVFVTHDASEAHLLADRVAVILDGEVAQHNAVDDVLLRPTSPSVAGFLGYALIRVEDLPAAIREAVSLQPGIEIVGVRPTAVRLVGDAAEDSALCLNATVAAVQGAHGRGRLLLDVGATRLAAELSVEQVRDLEIGAIVHVRIEPEGVLGW